MHASGVVCRVGQPGGGLERGEIHLEYQPQFDSGSLALFLNGSLKGELLHPVNESLPADIEISGGLALIPGMPFENLEEDFLFDLLKIDSLIRKLQADVGDSGRGWTNLLPPRNHDWNLGGSIDEQKARVIPDFGSWPQNASGHDASAVLASRLQRRQRGKTRRRHWRLPYPCEARLDENWANRARSRRGSQVEQISGLQCGGLFADPYKYCAGAILYKQNAPISIHVRYLRFQMYGDAGGRRWSIKLVECGNGIEGLRCFRS